MANPSVGAEVADAGGAFNKGTDLQFQMRKRALLSLTTQY